MSRCIIEELKEYVPFTAPLVKIMPLTEKQSRREEEIQQELESMLGLKPELP